MNLQAVSIGENAPAEVNVVIEVPIGGEPIKYEMDKASGALMVDRFLYTSMRYPGNYGFIPHTLSDDGDPCDVIVANTRAIIPGAIMSCRIVGVLLMEDEAGGDEKLLAVPSAKLTQRYARVNTFTDLPEITLKQIEHFFAHYKDLEPGKWVKIVRWGDAEEAHRLVNEGIARALGKGKALEGRVDETFVAGFADRGDARRHGADRGRSAEALRDDARPFALRRPRRLGRPRCDRRSIARQPLHRIEKVGDEARRLDFDRDIGVGRPAPDAAPVGDGHAAGQRSRRLDVDRNALGADQRRIDRRRDGERVVHGEDARAGEFLHRLEIVARRIVEEAQQRRRARQA